MKTLVVTAGILIMCLQGLSAQERKDTVRLNNKQTPHDTLEPFDRSSNKHIDVPNPNRPPSNATPPPPKRERKLAPEAKKD